MVNLEGTILIESLRNFVRMFISMRSWPDLKMGDEGSKLRSPDQILEKSFVPSIGHRFESVFKKNIVRMFISMISRPVSNWVMFGKKLGP